MSWYFQLLQTHFLSSLIQSVQNSPRVIFLSHHSSLLLQTSLLSSRLSNLTSSKRFLFSSKVLSLTINNLGNTQCRPWLMTGASSVPVVCWPVPFISSILLSTNALCLNWEFLKGTGFPHLIGSRYRHCYLWVKQVDVNTMFLSQKDGAGDQPSSAGHWSCFLS